MTVPILKKSRLLSAILLVFYASFSLAADADEQRQKLELLQRALQQTSKDESREDLEKKLQILKELLRKTGVTEDERKGLEEKLESLKKQLIPEEKPLIVIEEETATQGREKRFFIEADYWLAYAEGSDKEVASLYNKDTNQPIGTFVKTSPDPAGAFVISAGYKDPKGAKTYFNIWHLENTGSLGRNATSIEGISATESSDYYYQNIHQWTASTFSTRGVDRVDADLNLDGTNLDLIHSLPIGKGMGKEIGIMLGIKYTQLDSDIEITYSSTSSLMYGIKSDIENTLVGPLFGIYGEGPVFGKLRFKALMDMAITWNHSKAKRFEYDYTLSQAALDAAQAHDLTSTVIDGELGIRYPVKQNFSLNLDYKAAYFNGLPFELKTKESAFIDTLELTKKDILFHGLTAGVSYSF